MSVAIVLTLGIVFFLFHQRERESDKADVDHMVNG